MNKQEVVILRTWKWEEFIINGSYEEFMIFKNNLQNQWIDWFDSKDYRRFIKFSSLEHIIWKTRFLLLWEPNKEKKIFTEEEKIEFRKKRDEFIKKCLIKSEKTRRENFLKEKDIILNNLAKKEKYWWITTTLEKLEEYNLFKKKEVLNMSRNI